jgi:hypothetical protein
MHGSAVRFQQFEMAVRASSSAITPQSPVSVEVAKKGALKRPEEAHIRMMVACKLALKDLESTTSV